MLLHGLGPRNQPSFFSLLKKIPTEVLLHESLNALLLRPDVAQASLPDRFAILYNFSKIKNIHAVMDNIDLEVSKYLSSGPSRDLPTTLDIVSILKNPALYFSEEAPELQRSALASSSMSQQPTDTIDPSLMASSSQAHVAPLAAKKGEEQRELSPLKRSQNDSATSDSE